MQVESTIRALYPQAGSKLIAVVPPLTPPRSKVDKLCTQKVAVANFIWEHLFFF